MCKQVSAYQSCCYLLHTNCSAPQNPISKRLEEGTVCRNTAIEISKATALITLTLKKEMMLDDSWHPKLTFTFVALIGISPALPWDCFLLFFPCLCGGWQKAAEQALGLGALQCTLALQHNHHFLLPHKKLGNSTWEHAGRRDRDTAAASCGVPVPGMEGQGQAVSEVQFGAFSQDLDVDRGCSSVLEELSSPPALGRKEHSTGNAVGQTLCR